MSEALGDAVSRARRRGAPRRVPPGGPHDRHHEVHRPPPRGLRGVPRRRGPPRPGARDQGGHAPAPRRAPRAARRQRRAARRARALGGDGRGRARDRRSGSAGDKGVRMAVKSKSMATEEIDLNEALEAAGVTPVETDLGEYIIQLAHERPSHIIAPAIHKTKGQVAELFSRRARAASSPADPEVLTAAARERAAREVPRRPTWASPGANFAVAETGTVVLVTNEGNGRMVTSLPRIHVAVMGIEKVIPSMTDLVVFLALLARSATGQKLSSYTTLVRGPRRPGELEGPEEFHLILMDNGRIAADRGPAARGALLPPLRRLPERLPGVPPDRRPRVRPHVSRAHRHPPHRDAPGRPVGEGPRPRLVALRRVQGRVPGAHRHPADADRAARAGRRTRRSRPRSERARLQAWPAAPCARPRCSGWRARVGRLLADAVRPRGPAAPPAALLRRWTATRDLPPVARGPSRERWKDIGRR